MKTSIFFTKSKHVAISRNTYRLRIVVKDIETKDRKNNKGNENE